MNPRFCEVCELSLVNWQEKYFAHVIIVLFFFSDAFLFGNYVNTRSCLYQIRQCKRIGLRLFLNSCYSNGHCVWARIMNVKLSSLYVFVFIIFFVFCCCLFVSLFFVFVVVVLQYTLLFSLLICCYLLLFILYYNGKDFYHLLNSSRFRESRIKSNRVKFEKACISKVVSTNFILIKAVFTSSLYCASIFIRSL